MFGHYSKIADLSPIHFPKLSATDGDLYGSKYWLLRVWLWFRAKSTTLLTGVSSNSAPGPLCSSIKRQLELPDEAVHRLFSVRQGGRLRVRLRQQPKLKGLQGSKITSAADADSEKSVGNRKKGNGAPLSSVQFEQEYLIAQLHMFFMFLCWKYFLYIQPDILVSQAWLCWSGWVRNTKKPFYPFELLYLGGRFFFSFFRLHCEEIAWVDPLSISSTIFRAFFTDTKKW